MGNETAPQTCLIKCGAAQMGKTADKVPRAQGIFRLWGRGRPDCIATWFWH